MDGCLGSMKLGLAPIWHGVARDVACAPDPVELRVGLLLPVVRSVVRPTHRWWRAGLLCQSGRCCTGVGWEPLAAPRTPWQHGSLAPQTPPTIVENQQTPLENLNL